MRGFLPAIAVCAAFTTPAGAQDQREDAGSGVELNANESLFDVKWGFEAKGGLLLDPNPLADDATKGLTPYFPHDPIEGPLRSFLANSGSAGFLTVVLFGNEDLVSHCWGDYHFRRLGLDRSDQAMRMRIAIPTQGKTSFDRGLNALHRILAVRIVERRKLKSAIPELTMLGGNKNEATLLRWAAQDALATLTGKPVPPAELARRYPTLAETLAAVPDQYHAILSMDHSRIPFAREIPWLGRRMGLEITMRDIAAAGGAAAPMTLVGAQVLADSVSLAFFEIARNLGNFRIARVTATAFAGRGKKTPEFWARLDGHFDPAPLLLLLAKKGFGVEGDMATTPTHRVKVTRRFITVHTVEYPMEKAGRHADELRALGLDDQNQLFVYLAKAQRLTMMTGAPLTQVDGARFLGRLDADRKLTITAHCKNAAQARGLYNLIELGTKQALAFLNSDGAHRAHVDPKLFETLFMPSFAYEDESDVITMTWHAGKLTYANILKAVMGVEKAVSTQNGPRKSKK